MRKSSGRSVEPLPKIRNFVAWDEVVRYDKPKFEFHFTNPGHGSIQSIEFNYSRNLSFNGAWKIIEF